MFIRPIKNIAIIYSYKHFELWSWKSREYRVIIIPFNLKYFYCSILVIKKTATANLHFICVRYSTYQTINILYTWLFWLKLFHVPIIRTKRYTIGYKFDTYSYILLILILLIVYNIFKRQPPRRKKKIFMFLSKSLCFLWGYKKWRKFSTETKRSLIKWTRNIFGDQNRREKKRPRSNFIAKMTRIWTIKFWKCSSNSAQNRLKTQLTFVNRKRMSKNLHILLTQSLDIYTSCLHKI